MVASTKSRWLGTGLITGIGGMLFVLAVLFAASLIARLSSSAFLIKDNQVAVSSLATAWAVVSIAAFTLLRAVGWKTPRRLGMILAWSAGYLLLWRIAVALGGVTLPLFLGFWVFGGLLAAWAGSGRGAIRSVPGTPGFQPTATAQMTSDGTTSVTPAPRTVIVSGTYGRLPTETVALLSQHVRIATSEVLDALPASAPAAARTFTTSAVLARTLRDWWQNGNSTGLTRQDIADLRSFVALAADLSSDWQSAEGSAIYRAVLGGLLDDWLDNWNANGVDGPPQRS